MRVSYREASSGNLEIIEENHYYAFGLQHKGYNNNVLTTGSSQAQRYKYNGKELQDELNLGWYDYQARNYDPALGRWFNIDPLAETSRRFSPYAYCLDNPVYFIDPDGMEAEVSDIDSEGWIEEIGEGGTSKLTYRSDVNTVAQAKEAGFENASAVYESATVTSGEGNYSYDLAADGTVGMTSGDGSVMNQAVDASGEGITTEGGSTIVNNSGFDAAMSSIDNAATAIGTGMAAQQGTLEMAKKLAENTDDFTGTAGKLLNITKVIGQASGVVSAATAWADLYNNGYSTSGAIKAVANTALIFVRINPWFSVGLGILDATGVTDNLYDSVGNGIDSMSPTLKKI